ncbi:conserved hypothetical protein [delta proteobacterium NaphS2]|nr:conserved hypothetical protein [delta proteobacterium NaphS2]
MNIDHTSLEHLSKKELLDVIKLFSKNWLTVDGLWFTLVEDKYGLEAALELDLKMWERNALIEARRIKKEMGIEGGGIQGVLRALRFMSFDPSMPFQYSIEGPNEAHIWVSACRPQEGRMRAGRNEFPCKDMGLACYCTLAENIDPSVKVACVFCPPDSHPPEAWCKWRLTKREEDC